jgi:hypothetical protein
MFRMRLTLQADESSTRMNENAPAPASGLAWRGKVIGPGQ